jgi:hypothetical protein
MDEGIHSQRSSKCPPTTTFLSKIDDFVSRKEEKLKIMLEQKALKELEGCQFAPNIYTRRQHQNLNQETAPRRNFE